MKKILLSLLFVGLLAGVSQAQLYWTPPFAPPGPETVIDGQVAGNNVVVTYVSGIGQGETVEEAYENAFVACYAEQNALKELWERVGWALLIEPDYWGVVDGNPNVRYRVGFHQGVYVVDMTGDVYFIWVGGFGG